MSQEVQLENGRPLTLNRPQLLSAFHVAPIEVDIWGRGTGKTTSFAYWMQLIAHRMPRSNWAIVGRTFGQLQTIVIPQLIGSLEMLGYYHGVHYVVGRPPDKKMRFDDPMQPPLKYQYYLQWKTGTGFHLVSQDREGAGRGFNLDGVIADEGLTLIEDRFRKEIINANRGNEHLGWPKWLHHRVHITSSKPTGTKGNWLLDFAQYYKDEGSEVPDLAYRQAKLLLRYIDSKDAAERKQLWQSIIHHQRQIKWYKCKKGELRGVYYNEATSFDNIQHLGIRYLLNARKILSDLEFKVEVLNMTMKEVEDGFYKNLEEQQHCYHDTYNYSHLELSGWDMEKVQQKDSRVDGDVDPNRPLDISCDYGYYLNCMVVGQEVRNDHGWKYRFLNAHYAKPPKLIQDVATQFTQYYRHHPTKVVNYFYDHTAVGKDAGRSMAYHEQVEKVLKDAGWAVNSIYIGHVPSYESRYYLWASALTGHDDLPMPVFSMPKCRSLVLSMQLAGVVQGKHGFEKDKRAEKSRSVPQEEATHLSDAADILLHGKYAAQLSNDSRFIPMILSK